MPVEDAERHVVRVAAHEPHEEPVVPDVVRPHDDHVEEVPHPPVAHVLDHQLAHEVVGVVAVAAEEGGDQAKEFGFLESKKRFGFRFPRK